MLSCPLKDSVDAEDVVVRNGDVSQPITWQDTFCAGGHVAEMPCCHSVLWWTICLDVLRQEVVHLIFGGEAGCELFYRDAYSVVGFHIWYDQVKYLTLIK